jgi:hypothetical protein
MLPPGGDIKLEPTVMHMDDVLDEIEAGRLRVPAFQRPFVWRPEQMIDLFDSIERGYPIGSLLLWETDRPVPTEPAIAGIELPRVPAGTRVSYILDGHQRLSTLFGVLRRSGTAPRPDDQRDWKWWIYRDLRRRSDPTTTERYRHHSATLPTEEFLPLRAVSRTLDFLRFSRTLESRVGATSRVGEMIREAERIAQRIKGYKLPLIRLQGADLDQAVEVYTRLNRKGMRMEADQMVSALTYRKRERPTLASRIDDIVSEVAATGFGEVPRTAVFRAVLAIAGEPDIMSPRWEAVADRLQDKLYEAVPATDRAVRAAVEFLRTDIHLPLGRLLPYAHQLVLLAAFFHECRDRPAAVQVDELVRWFWVTSWASSFAGANSTTIRRALEEMRAFARGERGLTLDLAGVRPMPDEFNLNSARTRAYIIWELREFPRRYDAMGSGFDPVVLLRAGRAQVYRPIAPRDRRPANQIILPVRPNQTIYAALTDLGGRSREILESHGIGTKAWHRLRERRYQCFVDDRTEELTGRLRRFAEGVIGQPLRDSVEGVADDDTE